MKRITLIRISTENETGTYGVLKYLERPFAVTAERESLCNIKNRSCIPEGEYICKRVLSPSHGDCFEVQDVPGRSHILFHKGNIAFKDSAGCVLVAESFDMLGEQEAVLNSKHGYNDFMDILKGEDEFHFTIKKAA